MNQKSKILFLCRGAIVAALYVVLTFVAHLFGLDSGMIQLRISEALCVLPIFMSAAIPGLYIGCLLSNLLMGGVILDVLVGSLATLIGAFGAYALRKYPLLAPFPTVFANTLLVPVVLTYGYGMEQALPLLMLTVGIGEVLSAYVLGMFLYLALKKRGERWLS